MLIYTAFAIVFMIVSIAVPYMAAGIASGTIGLALSHAFEAAFITQTVIRPITSALQNGFKIVGRLGRVASEKGRRRSLAQHYRSNSGDTAARQR